MELTTGRIVHYYPNNADDGAAVNNAECVPAVVTQVTDKGVNLRVFQDSQSKPLCRRSVPVGENKNLPYCVLPTIPNKTEEKKDQQPEPVKDLEQKKANTANASAKENTKKK